MDWTAPDAAYHGVCLPNCAAHPRVDGSERAGTAYDTALGLLSQTIPLAGYLRSEIREWQAGPVSDGWPATGTVFIEQNPARARRKQFQDRCWRGTNCCFSPKAPVPMGEEFCPLKQPSLRRSWCQIYGMIFRFSRCR